MPLQFTSLDIADVILVETRAWEDRRGFFAERYKQSDYVEAGITTTFVQDNHSRSRRRVLRGLHYQTRPHTQAKLVMAITGEIFDVAVDLRRGSPTFGQWAGALLSADNQRMLFIPEGFAHGFATLSEVADIVYKVSSEYAPASERGIVWNDSDLSVRWPIEAPILSEKDAALPRLADAQADFEYHPGKDSEGSTS